MNSSFYTELVCSIWSHVYDMVLHILLGSQGFEEPNTSSDAYWKATHWGMCIANNYCQEYLIIQFMSTSWWLYKSCCSLNLKAKLIRTLLKAEDVHTLPKFTDLPTANYVHKCELMKTLKRNAKKSNAYIHVLWFVWRYIYESWIYSITWWLSDFFLSDTYFLWWQMHSNYRLCTAIVFVMPLMFNVVNGYSAGTGHLSWYLTNTKSSSSAVSKISRVILSLLLGSLHLRPACVCVCMAMNRVIQEATVCVAMQNS